MKIKLQKLNPDVKILSYAHPGDAGLDLYSQEDCTLQPGERHEFSLGFALEIPDGFVALVWDKSGLAFKHGIHSLGGVIDAGYRGEYKVTLINLGHEPYLFEKGDKLAQLLIQPKISAQIEVADKLTDSSRGVGAFGSTGKN